jgi:hypothetical protein
MRYFDKITNTMKKRIPTFESFLDKFLDKKSNGIIDAILDNLSDTIDMMMERILEEHTKKMSLPPTEFDKQIYRLTLIYDMVRSIEPYLLDTDTLKSVNRSDGSMKGNIIIGISIERNGEIHHIGTDVIYVGGYNIVKLHYRYIVKTKLRKVNNSTDTSGKLATKIKSMNKLEKLNKDIENQEATIAKWENDIATYSMMGDEQVIEYILNSERPNEKVQKRTLDIILHHTKYPENSRDEETEEQFKERLKKEIEVQISWWREKNITWYQGHMKEKKKHVEGLKKKLEKELNNN